MDSTTEGGQAIGIRRPSLTSMLAIALWIVASVARAQGVYMEADEFLETAFPEGEPATKTLWITEALRAPVEELLGHRFNALRVRYWAHEDKTAWIVDEIGKEKPITIGVVVRSDAVETVRVLEFREIRGWEVRYPFFTDQFDGAHFVDGRRGGRQRLDRQIDGITGATLSVGAVTRVVEVVLFLNASLREAT